MRRIFSSFLMVSVCSCAAFAGQSANSLEIISGPVFVNQGQGLVEADQFTLLDAGDQILMRDGSTALLVNNNLGCTMSLRDAGLYKVPDMTNCNTGQARVLQSDITITPTNGVYTPAPIYAGGGAASQGSALFGLGFFGIASVAVVSNTILEDDPVGDPVSDY